MKESHLLLAQLLGGVLGCSSTSVAQLSPAPSSWQFPAPAPVPSGGKNSADWEWDSSLHGHESAPPVVSDVDSFTDTASGSSLSPNMLDMNGLSSGVIQFAGVSDYAELSPVGTDECPTQDEHQHRSLSSLLMIWGLLISTCPSTPGNGASSYDHQRGNTPSDKIWNKAVESVLSAVTIQCSSLLDQCGTDLEEVGSGLAMFAAMYQRFMLLVWLDWTCQKTLSLSVQMACSLCHSLFDWLARACTRDSSHHPLLEWAWFVREATLFAVDILEETAAMLTEAMDISVLSVSHSQLAPCWLGLCSLTLTLLDHLQTAWNELSEQGAGYSHFCPQTGSACISQQVGRHAHISSQTSPHCDLVCAVRKSMSVVEGTMVVAARWLGCLWTGEITSPLQQQLGDHCLEFKGQCLAKCLQLVYFCFIDSHLAFSDHKHCLMLEY